MKFRTWLMKQTKRNDRVGDLARDVKQDEDTKKLANNLTVWRYHLIDQGAIDAAVEALIRAWVEYDEAEYERKKQP